MLDNKGFDKWAGDYDRSISRSEKGYPFEGYYDVLAGVQSRIKEPSGKKILDIGIGTGLLTNELYKQGALVHGIDFSAEMITLAKEKMPGAFFTLHDITNGVPHEFAGLKFDYIISSYALHHITGRGKPEFLSSLVPLLAEKGEIIIADIGFINREKLEKCRQESGDGWDDDEDYFIGDTILAQLKGMGIKAEYNQISVCAGILAITCR